ncbi:MAG TPA: recombination protein O N-terminal domain-containing protein [Candidatus Paceibacterota bacterium]|nr:recombination protein O N-terminal domain-containing protein [Candidatus Paceibacterota bacterium]
MYQKYQTEALVLRSYERGEADRVFALYTEAFGLVWARASAVRRESSRMRYALQNYAQANVALVRGVSGWRVVGAMALSETSMPEAAAAVFARIANLADRLIAGEEKNEYLYRALVEARRTLLEAPRETQATIELLCVARILYALGYLSADALGNGHASSSAEDVRDPASHRRAPALRRGPNPTSLFTHAAYGLPELSEVEAGRQKLLSSVNKAISETHL